MERNNIRYKLADGEIVVLRAMHELLYGEIYNVLDTRRDVPPEGYHEIEVTPAERAFFLGLREHTTFNCVTVSDGQPVVATTPKIIEGYNCLKKLRFQT